MFNESTDIEQELNKELAGVGQASSSKRFLDMLHDRFGANDWVVVKNPMRAKTGWIYSDPDPKKTIVRQVDSATQHVAHAKPEMKTLGPGQTIKLQGWEAYIALTRMWKQYAQTEFAGEQMSAHMINPDNRVAFINKAYLGIYDPNAEAQSSPKEETVEKPVEESHEKEKTVEKKPAPKSQKKDTKKTTGSKDDLGFAEE